MTAPDPNDVCTPDPAGGPCFCAPPSCDQSDPLTCGDDCSNPNDVCTPDPSGDPCFCAPPSCEQIDTATCGGDCPDLNDVCDPQPRAARLARASRIPVLCQQDQFPVCGGDCPVGSHCEAFGGQRQRSCRLLTSRQSPILRIPNASRSSACTRARTYTLCSPVGSISAIPGTTASGTFNAPRIRRHGE